MEKYIKPECRIVEVKFENCLMAGSAPVPPTSDTDLGWSDEVVDGPMLAPEHKNIWSEN